MSEAKRLLNEVLPDPECARHMNNENPRRRTIRHLKRILTTGIVLPVAACASEQVKSPAPPLKPSAPSPGYSVVDMLPIPTRETRAPGFLTLKSTPVADIAIDGEPTQLKTPQSNLPLPPGRHTIALSAGRLAQTFAVEIESGKTLSIDRDLGVPPKP
jgi:hypothetical protein